MNADPRVAEAVTRIAVRVDTGDGRFHGIRLDPAFDPRALLTHPDLNGVVASYERPSQGLALVAVGETRRVAVRRREGPSAARGAARRMLAVRVDADEPALRPRALGGFRFNPGPAPTRPWEAFGTGWLVLPRLLFVADGAVCGVVVAPGVDAAEVEPLLVAALRPPADGTVAPNPLREVHGVDEAAWCASVGAIAAEVRRGAYEKAVLATTLELRGREPIDVGGALGRLRLGYPDCHLFTMRAEGAVFLGASPELLVRLRDRQVETLGLAGSIGRGATEEDDDRLGRELLESAKNRIEHETVVRAIRERLEGATEDLRAPNAPSLRKLANIQHLSTPITGRARPGVDVLDLVRRLHPTPAVCGYPQDVARDVITEHERFDRGWYAGPVGWVDTHGEGEFAVGLRSALVRDDRAWLFAGNGIMGDSEPRSELSEVRLKFRPLAGALGGRAFP